jgi:ferredoxin
MSNFRNVSVRGRSFRVRAGDILLDGALANGVEIPHDCRAGTCGTCMVQVVKGQTVCGETHTQGMVHACQARVVSDLEVELEDVPEIDTTRARLAGVRELAPAIFELAIAPEKSIAYLPGQCFRFTFNGFPARAYSPGRIEAQLPPLEATDIVYACGSPRMVDALAGLVDSAGVTFYADPFEPAAPDRRAGLFGRLKTLVKARPNLQQSVEGALAGERRQRDRRGCWQPQPPRGMD